MDEIRFYFSFRSPYAWLAYLETPKALEGLPVALKPMPVFPPPDFPNDPAAVPAKLAYIMHQDMPRLTRALGLPWATTELPSVDIDWMPVHAMWVYALDQGKEDAFARGIYRARFGDALDLGDAEVVRKVATAAQLDPDATLAAGADAALHTRVMEGMFACVGDGLFGVPFFAYRDQRFWGHDRIGALVEAVARDHATA